ncbi:hypothetical protein Tco_1390780, partial [Tanacetum coccineum]
MLESEAYMTYRAYATGEKTPKPKSTKKKSDSESSPKTKPTQASKGKRIKTSAKGDKAAKMKQSATKSKGLTVLSEVALSEADQMKLATKRSKKEFHSSHASGAVDGVDIQSKVPDEQQHTVSGTNEGASDKPEKVSTPPDYELIEEEENQEDDDVMGGEQEDEEDEELYGDLNFNLDRRDTEMTDAQINKEKEKVHVTSLTTEPPVVQQQSSPVSSDLVAKFINPSPDIDKLREEAQAENQDFLNSLDSNMKRILKEQVKAQTSKIMTKVEKYVIETLEAKVLVRSTNQPQTSYAVASSLLELELKNILMDNMEENNYIDRSDVQKNLYRALLEAYNSNKDLLSSYGKVVILKRGCDDQDKDEE